MCKQKNKSINGFINLLETLFGQQKQNWGNWDNPFNNVHYIFVSNAISLFDLVYMIESHQQL